MDFYVVLKKIKGRLYRYKQKTWREGGKVKTLSIYLGPVLEEGQATMEIERKPVDAIKKRAPKGDKIRVEKKKTRTTRDDS